MAEAEQKQMSSFLIQLNQWDLAINQGETENLFTHLILLQLFNVVLGITQLIDQLCLFSCMQFL